MTLEGPWALSPLADIAAARQRRLRRTFVLSLLLHGLAVAALVYTPAPPRSRWLAPSVVTVDLVAAPSPPAPASRPKPRRKAPVVLPKKPQAPAARPEPKPRPKPKPKPEYEDVLAQLRAERGEEKPQPQPEPQAREQPATTAPVVAPRARGLATGGRPATPEVVAWVRDARVAVRRAWVLAPGFRTELLETHVVVRLDEAGRVVGEPSVTRRSGNPWYDESVVRAIQKASPLPPPPDAGDWAFIFQPQDAF